MGGKAILFSCLEWKGMKEPVLPRTVPEPPPKLSKVVWTWIEEKSEDIFQNRECPGEDLKTQSALAMCPYQDTCRPYPSGLPAPYLSVGPRVLLEAQEWEYF